MLRQIIRETATGLITLLALLFSFVCLSKIAGLKPYHPSAIACDFAALVMVLFCLGISRREDWYSDNLEPFAMMAALMAWVGFGWSLTERICLAGFCGFLGIALLCSIPITNFFKGDSLTDHQAEVIVRWLLRAGIVLVASACLLGYFSS